jgi:hypothetical protein
MPSEVPEIRLLARGLVRWQMSDEQRERAVNRILEILEHTDDPRAAAIAFQALVSADRVNVEREKLATGKHVTHHHTGAVGHVHTDLSRLSDEELDALQRRLAAERQAILAPPDPACAQAKQVEGPGTPRPSQAP